MFLFTVSSQISEGYIASFIALFPIKYKIPQKTYNQAKDL